MHGTFAFWLCVVLLAVYAVALFGGFFERTRAEKFSPTFPFWTTVTGYDVATKDNPVPYETAMAKLTKKFLQKGPIFGAVLQEHWKQFKWHRLKVVVYVKKQAIYTTVLIIDKCWDVNCTEKAGEDCCTTNANWGAKWVKDNYNDEIEPFLVDIERHSFKRQHGVDMMHEMVMGEVLEDLGEVSEAYKQRLVKKYGIKLQGKQ